MDGGMYKFQPPYMYCLGPAIRQRPLTVGQLSVSAAGSSREYTPGIN